MQRGIFVAILSSTLHHNWQRSLAAVPERTADHGMETSLTSD